MATKKYVQLYPGDSVQVEKGGSFFCACCDCGLVHEITPKSKAKYVTLTLNLANRQTGQYRRRMAEKGIVLRGKA